MSFKCKIGFHSWNRCICTECGKTRDEQHDWNGTICLECGKEREKIYFEKDNIGTRLLTAEKQANASNTWGLKGLRSEGFIYYTFKKKEDAYSAMTEISCMKIAADSKELICLEIIEFGVYWDTYNKEYWIAYLQGRPYLNYNIYHEAEISFIKHNGNLIDCREPEKKESINSTINDNNLTENSVKFIRKTEQIIQGVTCIKEIYEAQNKKIAIEFLKNKNIKEKLYYIEIETPDGWVGKDIDGVYET